MKSKNKIIIITIVILLVAVTVFSAPEIIEIISNSNLNAEVEEVKSEEVAIYKLKAEQEKGIDIQEDVEKYTNFIASLEPTQEEIKYIDTLIAKGYDIKALVEIFEFWKDTVEDIEIMEEVYKLKPAMSDVRYWVDSAFLQLSSEGKTKSEYSELTVEEVKEYYENGISYEDILFMDKLSRKGKKGIKELVVQKENSKSWYEIIDSVYEISHKDTQNTDIENYKEITDPYEIMASITLAEKESIPVSEYLDKVLEGESSIQKEFEIREKKYTEIKNKFIEKGLWSEEKSLEIQKANRKGGAF